MFDGISLLLLTLAFLAIFIKLDYAFIDNKIKINDGQVNIKKAAIFLVPLAAVITRVFVHDIHFFNWPVYVFTLLICVPDLLITVFGSRTIQTVMAEPEFAKFKRNNRVSILVFFISCLMPEFTLSYFLISQGLKNSIVKNSPAMYSRTDQRLNNAILMAYSLLLNFSSFYPDSNMLMLPVLLGTVAAYYLAPGIGKARLGKGSWISENNIANLKMNASHQLSWSILPDRLIPAISFLMPLVLFFEIFGVALLLPIFDAPFVAFVLFSFFLFHVSVLLSSGINFWKWCFAVLATIFIVLFPNQFNNPVESNMLMIYQLMLYVIIVCYYVFMSRGPEFLGWFDSPISKLIKFEISFESDKDHYYQINPKWFYPYDVIFSQNRFSFLFPNVKFLAGCLGAVRDENINRYLLHISGNILNEQEIRNACMSIINSQGNSVSHDQNQQNMARNIFLLITSIVNDRNTRSKMNDFISSKLIHIRNGYKTESLIGLKDDENVASIRVTLDRKFYSAKLNKFIDLDFHQYQVNVV